MEDVPWWVVAGWGIHLTGWAVAKVGGRRRGDGLRDAARVLGSLPAGSEVGGRRADGTTWYVRTPSSMRQGEADAR